MQYVHAAQQRAPRVLEGVYVTTTVASCDDPPPSISARDRRGAS